MTLEQLRMFIAVVEGKTFSAAAKKLNISQPSISVAIKNLEEELHLTLLDRSSYRPTLTPAGLEVFRQAKKILTLKDELKTTALLMASGEEKQLKIILDIVAPLPQILKLLRDHFSREPNCKLELSFCVLGSGLQHVVNNQADLYIGPIFDDIERESPIFHSHYSMVPVLSTTVPHAKLSLMELKDRIGEIPRVILRGGGNLANEQSPHQWADEGHTIFVEDYLIKRETIIAGLGWGRLPLWNIEPELANHTLIDLRSIFPTMKIQGDIFAVPKLKQQGKHLSAILEKLSTKDSTRT